MSSVLVKGWAPDSVVVSIACDWVGGFREKLTDTDNAQTLMAKDCGQRLEERAREER